MTESRRQLSKEGFAALWKPNEHYADSNIKGYQNNCKNISNKKNRNIKHEANDIPDSVPQCFADYK